MACRACNTEVENSDELRCVTCNKVYHYRCLNITTAYFTDNRSLLESTFSCLECTNITKRVRVTDDTPAKPPPPQIDDNYNMSSYEESFNISTLSGLMEPPLVDLSVAENADPLIALHERRITQLVKEAIAANMEALELNLIKQIKESFNGLVTSENLQLKRELMIEKEKSAKLETEVIFLKRELHKRSEEPINTTRKEKLPPVKPVVQQPAERTTSSSGAKTLPTTVSNLQ